MNLDKILDEIDNKIKNEFIKHMINEFKKTIELILSTLNTVKEPINYELTIKLFIENLIPELDNNFYNDTKRELFKFIKENSNDIFNEEQLNILTDKFLNLYYPYIKQEFINYLNSL